jgi:hypothetical protein
MMTSNGHSGVHHEADEAIDNLYAWMPPMTAATPPCPEAAFSITLKGKLGGQEALLTARGQSAEEFRRNLESIKGSAPAARPRAHPGAERGLVCGASGSDEGKREGRPPLVEPQGGRPVV